MHEPGDNVTVKRKGPLQGLCNFQTNACEVVFLHQDFGNKKK